MLEVKVLGSGCANCNRLEDMAKKAVQNLGLEADITHVTDFQKIMDYGVLNTPGLVINGKVVSSGKVPTEAEVMTYLTTALAEE